MSLKRMKEMLHELDCDGVEKPYQEYLDNPYAETKLSKNRFYVLYRHFLVLSIKAWKILEKPNFGTSKALQRAEDELDAKIQNLCLALGY